MKKFSFLKIVLIISLLNCKCTSSIKQKVPKKPNIIIIYTDDHELNEVGAFNGVMPTPYLDRIVNSGIKFTNFYVSSPVSTPSRYGTITGRYASRSKALSENYPVDDPAFIRWNTDIIPGKEKTVAHLLKESGYVTGMVAKGGIDFLEQNKDKPFFLYFNSTVPHEPNALESMKSDPRYTAMGLLDEPITGIMPPRDSIIASTIRDGYPEKMAAIRWLDYGIGALLQKLDELGLTENTMIIFASDNGRQGKMTCYEAAGHLPAAISWQGNIQPGTISDALVTNVDFVPTVLAAAGIDIPHNYQVDGISLLSHITEGKELQRDALYLEVVYQRAIVMKDWKYIATRFPKAVQQMITPANRREFTIEGKQEEDRYGGNKIYPGYYDNDQLYYLNNDPNEQHNVSGQPENREKLMEMKSRLRKVVKSLPHDFGEFKD